MATVAANSTASNNPIRVIFLMNLADALKKRYERTGAATDLEEATNSFYEAWSCRIAVPFRRVRAAAYCLKLLAIQKKFHIASNLGKDVSDLLPTVHTNLLDRNDQQFAMSVFAGIVADVCAVLLATGHIEAALEYLERGRAVIISRLLDRRSGISDLEGTHPKIARLYQRLVNDVNTPFRGMKNDVPEAELLKRRRELMDQLDACINEIRSIKGHERFLLSQTLAEMQECAAEGSIVVINATEFRSDAIILTRTTIKSVSLPKLSAAKTKVLSIEDWARQSRGLPKSIIHQDCPWSLAGHAARDAKLVGAPKKDDKFRGSLERLWSDCVRLVIEELGFCKNQSEELPRIWWIGTGLASSLPFHAAGDHSTGSTENTLSWAISSYTSTIKALRYARAKKAVADTHSILLVTMPNTPGETDLPGVKAEAKEIRDATQHLYSIQELERPSKETVQGKLGDFSIAHLACHGFSDLTNPSSSFLALQGNSDSNPEKLTVREILDINLGRAWLAYLSACSTAQNEVLELADENLHLASGFQVAGFRHVVASMWPSNDAICVQVASVFYRSLISGLERDNTDRAVAAALHAAVKDIRLRNVERPYLWAQYIHLGA